MTLCHINLTFCIIALEVGGYLSVSGRYVGGGGGARVSEWGWGGGLAWGRKKDILYREIPMSFQRLESKARNIYKNEKLGPFVALETVPQGQLSWRQFPRVSCPGDSSPGSVVLETVPQGQLPC